MFEISQLKEMKLPELQEIAKKLSVPKFRSMKKLDLVYQILDKQAADPKAVLEVKKEEKEQILSYEDSEDTSYQQKVKDEEILWPVSDVP